MGGKDLEMLDVDAQHAAEPSLQRLKTLDSLPDLKSQLKTANEYCNHGHRAEMIIKWLTAKMQSDAKAASNVDAWTLLEHCFRLVAPQKMVILLARFHLLDTARTSMQNLEGKKLAKLLDAITKGIETLEEISSGSDGAVVKQLLSTDGASAPTAGPGSAADSALAAGPSTDSTKETTEPAAAAESTPRADTTPSRRSRSRYGDSKPDFYEKIRERGQERF